MFRRFIGTLMLPRSCAATTSLLAATGSSQLFAASTISTAGLSTGKSAPMTYSTPLQVQHRWMCSPTNPIARNSPQDPTLFRVTMRELVGDSGSLGQADRLPEFDEEVHVYPTPERIKLWGSLDEEVLDSRKRTSSTLIGVTGISGCGKSHALLWWAKKQMDAGHLVVYVQNGDTFARSNWGSVLHETLRNAAKKMWLKGGVLGGGQDAEELWSHANEQAYQKVLKRAKSKWLGIRDARTLVTKAPHTATALFFAFFKVLIQEVTAFVKSATRVPTIFIVDQDNRLHRAMRYGSMDARRANKYFVTGAPFALTVVCAPANNEDCWKRRSLAKTFTLPPERVPPEYIGLPYIFPMDALVKAAGLRSPPDKTVGDFLEDKANAAFGAELERATNFLPLELRRCAEYCRRQSPRPDLLKLYLTARRTTISGDLTEFISRSGARRLNLWQALEGLPVPLGPQTDRRYLSKSADETSLQFITPVAQEAAAGVIHTAYQGLQAPPRDASIGMYYELKVARYCQKKDLLRARSWNARRVGRWTTLDALLNAPPDPSTVFYVPPTDLLQRAFDFTLITGIKERGMNGNLELNFCVFFVQCCHSYEHKDSFRDLVVTGDSYWLTLPTRLQSKCYLGYLWVTPTDERLSNNLVLELDAQKVFFHRPQWDDEWSRVISNRLWTRGRQAKSLDKDAVAVNKWAGFPCFDEMHISALKF